MFSSLSESISGILDKLKGKGYLKEDDINQAMREIRIALLEADVSLSVTKKFIENVKQKALGSEVIKSVSPGQMVVKIVNDELTNILGEHQEPISFAKVSPTVIMMVGLQGSGKTTSTAKLALHLRKKYKKKALMASLDVYRPAAQEQLAVLGKQISTETLEVIEGQKPVDIAKRALDTASKDNYDILLLDTAGRLHTSEELMEELEAVKKVTKPHEIILVADGLTGQDSVNIATQFNDKLSLSGIILTRLDGDARGGAALSMKQVTGKAIKFIGTGEKTNALEEFHPDRIASRILQMGDIVSLVEKASEEISEEEAKKITAKMQKGQLDLNDLKSQFAKLRKLGGLSSMLSMVPGLGKLTNKLGDMQLDDGLIKRQEAIINSMTEKERKNPKLINSSRKKRIANGSGTKVQDVNRLLKQFVEMSNMAKKFSGMNPKEMKKFSSMFNNGVK